MESLALLQLLADGEFHSGEELGRQLGISRAAIWKQVQRLEQETALEVESAKGRGYRIAGAVELLETGRIIAALQPTTATLLSHLEHHNAIDSTNQRALSLAQQNPDASGVVVTAEYQSAGRGRRGRGWVSPFARNLYCSVLWRFDTGASALEGLSLAVGVAVVRSLASLGVEGVRLKWPNDVIWRGRKLAGILVEMTGDPAGSVQAVIGVGINVDMRAASAESIGQPWVDTNEIAGTAVSRNALLSALLDELLPLLASYHERRFAAWRQEWEELDDLRDSAVRVQAGEVEQAGIARGVSPQGALLLDVDGELRSVFGGEISLRAQ